MYEAESLRNKSRQVRVVQEPPLDQQNGLVKRLKQNKAAMDRLAPGREFATLRADVTKRSETGAE